MIHIFSAYTLPSGFSRNFPFGLRRFFRQTRMADVAVVHIEEDASQLAREVVFLGDLFRRSTALDVIVGATIQAGHHLVLFGVICFRTDGKFSSAKKVQYFQRKPKPKTETMENQLEPSVEDCKKMVYSNWFLKQKGWEYEREWRIVEESTSNYFDYNPGELVGIILGTNLDSHIGDAIKHCVPSSVRILKAWPGQRTFEILITDGEYQKLGDGSPIPKITDIDSFLSSNV